MKITHILSVILLLIMTQSCQKEYDNPPIKTLPQGSILTIADLHAMFVGTSHKFTGDSSVFAVVTADERSGNLYKNVYVQDGTGGVVLRLLSSGGLYQGDSIRIYLKNTVLSEYKGQLQIDSVDVADNVIKQATDVIIQPKVITIDMVGETYESQLITIENAQFLSGELGNIWADPVNLYSENRMLEDCSGNQLIVRSSGYASFAGDTIPSGNGSITGVLGQYDTDWQLFIRTTDEAQLDGTRCTQNSGCTAVNGVYEDFASVTDATTISLNCWTNAATVGSRYWQGSVFNTEYYAEATAYSSSDASNECWLVTPEIQFSGNDTLHFLSAMVYWVHNGLDVWISTDYDGSNVSGATWNQISCTIATQSDGNYTWVPSGDVLVAPYLPLGYSGTYYIGFRYSGNSASQTTNYRLDNIEIAQ